MKFSTEVVASIFRRVLEATANLIENGADGDLVILRPDTTNPDAMFLRSIVGGHEKDEHFQPAPTIDGLMDHLNKMAQECAAVAETIENMTLECSVVESNQTTPTGSDPQMPGKTTEMVSIEGKGTESMADYDSDETEVDESPASIPPIRPNTRGWVAKETVPDGGAGKNGNEKHDISSDDSDPDEEDEEETYPQFSQRY